MTELCPREIDKLPRETIVALLKFIEKQPQCSTMSLGLALATFENKTLRDYSNDYLRQISRFLIERGFVTGGKIYMGRNLCTFNGLEVTAKGVRYLDPSWFLAVIWDQLKDLAARIIAKRSGGG